MLYDKYQFHTIGEIYGHESIKKDLKKRFKERDYPRVSLFSGQSGIGKTNLIHLLSKSILCPDKDKEGNPCNNCRYCQSIDRSESIANYKEYNCSTLGIKEVEAIIEGSTTRSLSEIDVKIIVLDELQQLKSEEAQKSLLKILEKNNKNVIWILGTMAIDKIDISVVRRTTLYKLNPISFDDLVYYLVSICKKEGINDIETDENKVKTLFTIAENSGGSVGVCLAYLERCIGSEIWTETELIKELELYSKSSINKILNYMLIGDVTLFDEKLTKTIIPSLFKKLIAYYKYSIGGTLNHFEKKEIEGVVKTDKKIISFVINELNKLNNQYYLSSDMIQYSFLNIVDYVRQFIPEQKPTKLEERPARVPRS